MSFKGLYHYSSILNITTGTGLGKSGTPVYSERMLLTGSVLRVKRRINVEVEREV